MGSRSTSARTFRRSRAGTIPDSSVCVAFDVYTVSGDPEPLGFVLGLAEQLLEAFYDAEDGRIYFTRDLDSGSSGARSGSPEARSGAGDAFLFTRPQELTDRSTPSSLGVAVETLTVLDGFRTDRRFREVARTVLATHSDRIRASPLEHVSLVRAAERVESGGIELTIAADEIPNDWTETLAETYLPGAVVAPRPPTSEGLEEWLNRLDLAEAPPIWTDRGANDGAPTVYACEGSVCSPPKTEIDWLVDR